MGVYSCAFIRFILKLAAAVPQVALVEAGFSPQVEGEGGIWQLISCC